MAITYHLTKEPAARALFHSLRWPNGPECHRCLSHHPYACVKRFKCRQCGYKYSLTSGTVFENTKIPLHKWFLAIHLCINHKKGVSSCQLARDLGVTQKTAWFMLHRIREALRSNGDTLLKNMVEADVTFVGGKIGNKSNTVRKKVGETRNYMENKVSVLGVVERNGPAIMQVMPRDNDMLPDKVIRSSVEYASTIVTDEGGPFARLNDDFYHYTVQHTKDEYVRGKFHTNSIEGVFSHFKRGIYGIYHHVSPWHLQRYCDEFVSRWNSRKMKDEDRMEMALGKMQGRLKYGTLVAAGREKA